MSLGRMQKIICDNPSFINEKPPYRRYYLVHHLVCIGMVKTFLDFQSLSKCEFDLNLLADGKSIYQIAYEWGSFNFADVIKEQNPDLLYQIYEPSVECLNNAEIYTNIIQQKSFLFADENYDPHSTGKKKNRTEFLAELEENESLSSSKQKQIKSNNQARIKQSFSNEN
ncbi:unnamed protein product [Didymodactylos carnosus]|uniref:Uncharacterized protein n=1 Tax=Didymodactylos carnosus TaxID=1234261 RepID=A0A816AIH2_9BILA|nr:unnamed protein product [Didymodactylos carnosus]CAF4469822.1 unnamed protein product [Didymodactylos carnosus]